MSLVQPREESAEEKSSLEDVFLDRLPMLGILETTARRDWEKVRIGLRIQIRRRITNTKSRDEKIMILSFGMAEKLAVSPEALRENFISRLVSCNTVLLIFAQSVHFPSIVKNLLNRHRLPAAISSFSTHLLESRIKAIIGEKIEQRITIHGVAVELQGRGILIIGESGVGKTTAALKCLSQGDAWVADDLVIISGGKNGKLFLSGHRKIKKYFHTSETGITAVDSILEMAQIKKKTELTMILEIVRADGRGKPPRLTETEMMKIRVPFLTVTIPETGYFDKNLLIKYTKKFIEAR